MKPEGDERELAHGDCGVVDDDAFHRVDRSPPGRERQAAARDFLGDGAGGFGPVSNFTAVGPATVLFAASKVVTVQVTRATALRLPSSP